MTIGPVVNRVSRPSSATHIENGKFLDRERQSRVHSTLLTGIVDQHPAHAESSAMLLQRLQVCDRATMGYCSGHRTSWINIRALSRFNAMMSRSSFGSRKTGSVSLLWKRKSASVVACLSVVVAVDIAHLGRALSTSWPFPLVESSYLRFSDRRTWKSKASLCRAI